MASSVTVTASGSGTATVQFQWELGHGGVQDDGTQWLGGSGGGTYPGGGTTPFQASNTDGSNDYTGGVKWLSIGWAGAANTETLTLSGDVSTIHGVFQGGFTEDTGGTAIAASTSSSGLVITLTEAATGAVTGTLLVMCS